MKKASRKSHKASSSKASASSSKGKATATPAPKVKAGAGKKAAVSSKLSSEVLQKLMALGKKQGFVTIEQMKKQLPEEMNNPEKVEEVISALNEKGIEVSSAAIGDAAHPAA